MPIAQLQIARLVLILLRSQILFILILMLGLDAANAIRDITYLLTNADYVHLTAQAAHLIIPAIHAIMGTL